jgi:hypothetical protein
MLRCSFIAVLSALALSASATAAERALPSTWDGDWSGTITVYPPNGGSPFDRPMEIVIASVDEGRAFEWKVTSSMKGRETVRDYVLVPIPDKPGEFKLDEKNGIVLNTRLMGNALYSYYLDGDILISGRYERRGDSLFVELTSVATKDPLVSEIKEEGVRVQSYRVGSVQNGELKRK